MSSIIVYNAFDSAAVITAAILMSNKTDIAAVEVTKIVPQEHSEYFWIGVDPLKYSSKFYDYDEKKTHHVFVDKTVTEVVSPRSKFTSLFKKSTVVSSTVDEDATELQPHENSLIEQVCKYVEVDYDDFRRLSYQASLFNEKETKIMDLVFVYKNLMAAHRVLSGRECDFTVEEVEADDVIDYLKDVKVAKTSLTGAYQRCFIYDDKRTKRVFYTCIDGIQYQLAQRLIRLSHRYFLNVVMTVNGIIAYTNLKEFTTVELKEEVLLLNA